MTKPFETTVDWKKFKPRDQKEATWLKETLLGSLAMIKDFSLPVSHIRVGRQTKSWGSSGVRDVSVSCYRQKSGAEMWINAYHLPNMDRIKASTFYGLMWHISKCEGGKYKPHMLGFDKMDIPLIEKNLPLLILGSEYHKLHKRTYDFVRAYRENPPSSDGVEFNQTIYHA